MPTRQKNITPEGSGRNPPAPRLVSQLTCEAVVGMNPRRFLELLPSLGIPVAAVGKLRLVQIDLFEAAVMRLATTEGVDVPIHDQQPATPDAVLAKLGLRRSA